MGIPFTGTFTNTPRHSHTLRECNNAFDMYPVMVNVTFATICCNTLGHVVILVFIDFYVCVCFCLLSPLYSYTNNGFKMQSPLGASINKELHLFLEVDVNTTV